MTEYLVTVTCKWYVNSEGLKNITKNGIKQIPVWSIEKLKIEKGETSKMKYNLKNRPKTDEPKGLFARYAIKKIIEYEKWFSSLEAELRENLALSIKLSAPQNKYAVGYQTAIKEILKK